MKNRIRTLRTERGWTQADLEKLAPRISQLERALNALEEARSGDKLALDFPMDGSVDISSPQGWNPLASTSSVTWKRRCPPAPRTALRIDR